MKNIFVSGASGIVGYGILKSLRMSGKPLKLVGSSIYDDSVAPAFCDVFELAPPTDRPDYMDWLMATIRKHNIGMIVPGIEIDMYSWIEHAAEIESAGAIPLLNERALIEFCKDKWSFYQKLRETGWAEYVIESCLEDEFAVLEHKFGLPFLLKPRRGFGSKGIVKVEGEATFALHRHEIGQTLMAQPLIGTDNEEYTTSAFCNGQGGYHACMTLRRKLSTNGFTEKAEVVDSDDFIPTITDLCQRFRPLGPTNFQFRKCTDGVKLLEINPRVSSSSSIRSAFGYNESAMAVEYFLEHKTPVQPVIKRGKAVRYTEDYIFYEDRIHL
jgi:carbamoyl-phosphate synthase large subunit